MRVGSDHQEAWWLGTVVVAGEWRRCQERGRGQRMHFNDVCLEFVDSYCDINIHLNIIHQCHYNRHCVRYH